MENGPFTLVTHSDESFAVETLYLNRHYAEKRLDTLPPSVEAAFLYGPEGLVNSFRRS